MQDLCLTPCRAAAAARSARSPNQPDTDAPSTPAADSLSQSRRVIRSCNMVCPPVSWRLVSRLAATRGSMVRHELGAVEQRPQYAGVALRQFLVLRDVGQEPLPLALGGAAGQGAEEHLLQH